MIDDAVKQAFTEVRGRIGDHVETWTFREMIRQIKAKLRPEAHVVFHELPITTSPRELAAYETELIRSRRPEHNRTGSISTKQGQK
jgi:CTP synthase (UTP-ammonia lyase)